MLAALSWEENGVLHRGSDSRHRETVTAVGTGADGNTMRRAIVPLAGIALGLLAFGMVNAARVSADTPVTVLAGDRVVLLLPVSPSVERIVGDLRLELQSISEQESDPRITRALDRVAGDDDLLHQVATTPADMFFSGTAVATATPVFDVDLGKDRVIVTTITVELVPAYGSTAGSREHEDGHALINEKIATRCARDALLYGLERGYQGQGLINTMVSLINLAADPVHARYHSYVGNASYGQHIPLAEESLGDVEGCQFSPGPSL